jgi:LmbE family N-acetylglucosaminyl deacetylase
MKDLTILIAHPDDEVIFGWPVLKHAKTIVCCSSDLNNPTRQWCRDRKKALQEVGAMTGAEVKCLDYDSEFYRADARRGDLARLAQDVLGLLPASGPIFTHNPWGEYGHMDHILVHQIARAAERPIMFSDMQLEAGWLPRALWMPRGPAAMMCEIDPEFYRRCKEIYDRYGCWTWSNPPIMSARVYADN